MTDYSRSELLTLKNAADGEPLGQRTRGSGASYMIARATDHRDKLRDAGLIRFEQRVGGWLPTKAGEARLKEFAKAEAERVEDGDHSENGDASPEPFDATQPALGNDDGA